MHVQAKKRIECIVQTRYIKHIDTVSRQGNYIVNHPEIRSGDTKEELYDEIIQYIKLEQNKTSSTKTFIADFFYVCVTFDSGMALVLEVAFSGSA